MNKILFIVLLGLTSCMEPNIGYPAHESKAPADSVTRIVKPYQIEVEFSSIPLTVVVIDSCEYLYGPWGNGTVLCHKGNCKNHIYK